MTFQDVKALNGYYMLPRPVFLLSVRDGEAENVFPVDLLGEVSDGHLVMALRKDRQSAGCIRAGRALALSSLPGRYRSVAYALAAQHHDRRIDPAAIPFPVRPSVDFGLPVPADALRVRELEVVGEQTVGSHVVFVSRCVTDHCDSDEPQLCHVSDTYARWRERDGRAFTNA